jgi:hypothetical protein
MKCLDGNTTEQQHREALGSCIRARRQGLVGLVCLAATLLLLSVAQATPPLAAGAGGTDARLDLLFGEHDPYRAFLRALQTAVAADDRKQVAAMVSYPLRAKLHGHALSIHTTQQFLSHYDELLPRATRTLIAAQTYEALFVNAQGVMIGSGQVWFSGVCNDELCSRRPIKVIGFNPGS